MSREVYDVGYESRDNRLAVKTLERDDSGEKVVRCRDPPFDPYCYIESDDFSMMECRRHGVRPDGRAPDDFVRIEADHPAELRDYDDRAVHRTYEAGTDYASDVLIDEDWSVRTPEPSDILYFDIEVDDRGEFAEADRAPDRIISIAAVGGDGEEYFYDYDHERELIRQFVRDADDYAVLVGWNAEDYDFPYLDNRALDCGIDVDWDRWVRLDLMALYDQLARPTETLSLKLDDTAKRELGDDAGKTGVKPGQGRLYELWRDDDPRLEEYNIRDAEILREINGDYESVELLFTLCDICGYPPGETIYVDKHGNTKLAIGMIVDAKVRSVAHDRGVPMMNRGEHADTGEFPGGDVLDPTPGMHEDVVTVDYSGMYPSIIRAFNFGPTTWAQTEDEIKHRFGDDCHVIEGESGYFVGHDTKKSILAEAAEDLDEVRQESKDAKEDAQTGTREYEIADQRDKGVKVANNTLYGIFASPFHRYYVPGMSENITLIGQKLVDIAARVSDEHPKIRRVLYGDTDSVMIEIDSEEADDRIEAAKEVAAAIEAEIQRWASEERGASGELLKLDVDYVWDRFFQNDKKKRYFGRVIYDDGSEVDKVKYKGLEVRQNDVPEPCRDMQEELIHARCHDEPTMPIVEEWKDRLYDGELDLDMATRKGLGKPVREYKADTPPLHVRAAEAIRDEFGRGEIQVGNKVGYIKYGAPTGAWTWVHDGEMGRPLNHTHYRYLWEEKFVSVMESVGVTPDAHEQAGLDAFAAAGGDD